MQQPLVSVIIPTYNRADKVITAIESVEQQVYKNIQLIVVDDGSTDHTRELLSSRPGIEYLYQENGGQAAARNRGLAHAKGQLIASLDSDDYWVPTFLDHCVGALTRYNVDFVFANWNQKSPQHGHWEDFLSPDPHLKPFCKQEDNGWFLLDSTELRKLYLQACPSPSSSTVMKKRSITAPWNQNLNIGDDWGLYLDMILSRPCKAAFTLERLWYKDMDGQNVFEGRERAEVVKLLLIDDTKEIINRYQDRITVKERKILEKQYVEGLMELGKHILVREYKVTKAWRLFREAFSISFAHSASAIIKLSRTAFDRRYQTNRQLVRGGES